jgi:hypothetical protein
MHNSWVIFKDVFALKVFYKKNKEARAFFGNFATPKQLVFLLLTILRMSLFPNIKTKKRSAARHVVSQVLTLSLFISGFLLSNEAEAQITRAVVKAPSGMNVRTLADTRSRVLKRVNYLDTITINIEKLAPLTIDTVSGHWRKIYITQSQSGYIWDGYLEILSSAKVETNIQEFERPLTRFDSLKLARERERLAKLDRENADTKVTLVEEETTQEVSPQEASSSGIKAFDSLASTGQITREQNIDLPRDKKPTPPVEVKPTPPRDKKPALPTENKQPVQIARSDENRSKSEMPMRLLLETYNYCGNVSDIDVGTYWWWAFIPDENFIIPKRTEVLVQLSNNRLSDNYEFDIVTNLDERSYFLIGMPLNINFLSSSISNPEVRLQNLGRKVMPGINFPVSNRVSLYALGNVTDLEERCPEVENYKLFARIDEDLKIDLLSIMPKAVDCPIPDLYFYGDLNDDGLPEMIFVFTGETKNHFYLLWSDYRDKSYSVVGSFEMKDCD